LSEILATVIIMTLFIVATSPESMGKWEARKNMARDQYIISTEK
jgi:hypothetical protein